MQGVRLAELFAQQVHISRLQTTLKEYTSPEKQLEILKELKSSGSPAKYQFKVLDHLTRRINNSTTSVEMTDELSEEHAQALIVCMGTGQNSTGPSPVIYRFDSHEVTIVEERDTLAKAGGTGYRTWEAALALGDFLIKNPIQEKNVLELGAGTGFVSRVLIELGYNVLSTDGDPAILEGLEGLNAKSLWWETHLTEDLREFQATLPFKDFVIVAADVLYDPNNYAPFLFTVSKLLVDAKYALVATTMRNLDTYALLDPECEKLGMEITPLVFYHDTEGEKSDYFFMNGEQVKIIKLTLK